jgi:hypothetical protein
MHFFAFKLSSRQSVFRDEGSAFALALNSKLTPLHSSTITNSFKNRIGLP